MMASNILSRFLPPATGSPSIYETLRQQDDAGSDISDLEAQIALAADEESLGDGLEDYELDEAGHAGDEVEGSTTESTTFLKEGKQQRKSGKGPGGMGLGERSKKSQWMRPKEPADNYEEDDEVPASLLFEGDAAGMGHDPPPPPPRVVGRPVPGPSTRRARAQWEATQAHQRLHDDEQDVPRIPKPATARLRGRKQQTDPKEHAMWIWANVDNMDYFLYEVYHYFVKNGVWSIMLERLINLL
jgi:autophagy-related protein 9